MAKKTVPQNDPPAPLLAHLKVCPECAGPLLRGARAIACAHCGWARSA